MRAAGAPPGLSARGRLGWQLTARSSNLLGVLLPVAIAAALVLFDVLEGPVPRYTGLAAATPLMAASLAGPARTAFVGGVVTFGAYLSGFLQEDAPGLLTAASGAHQVRTGFILAACVAAVVISYHRERRTQLIVDLSSVAGAAQDAILRPLPAAVGAVRCAATYVSATDLAQIGGDMIEVLDTRHGVRVLVGDVRGKGMGAVRLAGSVVGAFREHAWTAPDLPTLAGSLDAAVEREGGPEDFVTAALLEIHEDGTVLVVSCGHPAPFLAGPGFQRAPAVEVDVVPSPPLGLMMGLRPVVTRTEMVDNQRLVLVTDGVLEARRPPRWYDRRSGEFLPAAEVLGRSLSRGPLRTGLTEVVDEVRRWNRGRLVDDMAVLVMEHRGRCPRSVPAPAAEGLGAAGWAVQPERLIA